MATIFLSHASGNDAAASMLEEWLTTQGFRDVFIDHDTIRAGDKWAEELRRAKASCRIVLCIVSPEWLESDECYGEFKAAWYMGRRIIPLLWLADQRLNDRQRNRLDNVLREDQGVVIPYTGNPGDFDLSGRISEVLQTGLRAAGALVNLGLDPAAFAIDRTVQPEPFPGLESFGDTEADAAIFYGRGPEIAQCLEDLREMRATGDQRVYAIQGASGSGKSSLLKAGILPRLRRERGWLGLRTFRPGTDPLYNFADALVRTLSTVGPASSPGATRDKLFSAWKHGGKLRATLDEIVAPLRKLSDRRDATVLIAMDQSEEFARMSGESADALGAYFKSALVGDAGEKRLDYLVILTVRSDSFHDLQQSPRFEGIRVRTVDVRTPAMFQFGKAIEEPAARYGVEIEPRLVEQMMSDASGADALPLLAFTLQRLWRQYAQDGRIGKEAYENLGRLSGIIADAAERALRGIDPMAAQAALDGAVSESRVRHAARVFVPAFAQVDDRGAAIRRVAKLAAFDADDIALIESFARWRLIVVSADSAEVAHEAMFRVWPRFHSWLEPEKDRLSALQGLESAATVWNAKGRRPVDLVHRGKRLAEARALAAHREYSRQLDRNPETRPYLEGCRLISRRRRLLVVGAASGFTLVVALLASIPVLLKWAARAEAQRHHAAAVLAAEHYTPSSPILKDGNSAATLKPGSVFRDCKDCPEMVVIPGGKFMMGSPPNESSRGSDESPQHQVTLAPFAIGRYDITFDDWDICVKAHACPQVTTPLDYHVGRGRRPVIAVSWYEANTYARWLSKRTHQTYRLPSEAEWEYAARGGTTTAYYTGASINHEQANFGNVIGSADPVGTYPPNPFGLYDMAGSVWQWVEDCYNVTYEHAPDDGSAWESGDCTLRVIRGGSWYNDADHLRSAVRNTARPTDHPQHGGFRLVRVLTPP